MTLDPVHELIRALKPLFKDTSSPHAHTTLSNLLTIFGGKATAEIFCYLCLYGAATSYVLQRKLNLSDSIIYRSLSKLHAIGIIDQKYRTLKEKRSRGGPRYIIWARHGATRNDVVEARRLHHRTVKEVT